MLDIKATATAIADAIISGIIAQQKELGYTNTGKSAKSLHADVKSGRIDIWGVEYFRGMFYGVPPNKAGGYAPKWFMAVIFAWAKQKGVTTTFAIAALIANNIWREGTAAFNDRRKKIDIYAIVHESIKANERDLVVVVRKEIINALAA